MLVWIELFAAITMYFGVHGVRSRRTLVVVQCICTVIPLLLCLLNFGWLIHKYSLKN